MEINFKECPICYSKKIVRQTGTVTRKRNRKEVRVPHVRYTKCLSCGERFYSSATMKKMEAYLEKIRAAA